MSGEDWFYVGAITVSLVSVAIFIVAMVRLDRSGK